MADRLFDPAAGEIVAFGFAFYKRSTLRDFFAPRPVRHVRHVDSIVPGSTVAVWGATPLPTALERGCRVVRLEDGFLRSVGLGADLIRPLSWVVDQRGIYFDATRPSDLEHLLQHHDFSTDLLERAARLRQRIVQAGLTKYNVGACGWRRPPGARRVVLVPGQVETDASIALGAGQLRTNLALLRQVRAACPQAHLLYKPHPDVVAGLRLPGEQESQALHHCDEVVADVPMAALLDQVDEVHLLTSLTGFEALLRGKPVTCHGQPFYAGWGLTEDVTPHARRGRRRSLDELVAAALILYPRYLSPHDGSVITPEAAVDQLVALRQQGGDRPGWRSWLLRPLLRALAHIEDGARRRQG